MSMIESPLFDQLIKTKSLSQPTARRFDRAAWIRAAEALPELSERDQHLLFAALHYGGEIAALRKTFENSLFEGLDRRSGLLLAVAMANYNYRVLTEKALAKARESVTGDVVHLGYIGRQLMSVGAPGNEATPDTVVSTIVDTLPHCLERVKDLPVTAPENNIEFWDRGSRMYAVMSIEHSLRNLWNRVLWDGWKLTRDGGLLRQGPVDRKLATLWEAWIWRHEMVLSQGAYLDALSEKMNRRDRLLMPAFVSPTVIGIRGKTRETRTFRFGDVSGFERGQTWHRSEAAILEDSYLAQFLDAPLPSLDNVFSCRTLQRIWCVLRDGATVLNNKAKDRKFESVDAIESLALLIRRSEVERALIHCAGIEPKYVKRAIGFITSDLSNMTNLFTKGFWAAPLLEIDEDNVAIVFPALRVGSAVRRVEAWLEHGGLSDHLADARRGLKYEAWVRSETKREISKNRLLPNAKSAANPVYRKQNDDEQIDLLIMLEGILIVGEVKCLLYPIEASEHYNYLKKLDDAGDQAVRKANWINDNRKIIAESMGISLEQAQSLRTIPIVVTNQGAGFSLTKGGARIVDFHFLSVYLSTNEYLAGTAHDFEGQRFLENHEELYKTERQAAEFFEETMENPPPLERYLKAAVWTETEFPTSDGGQMLIEVCELGSSFTEEAEKIASILRPS